MFTVMKNYFQIENRYPATTVYVTEQNFDVTIGLL